MRCLVCFASSEGQTERIAAKIAKHLKSQGVPADLHNLVRASADEVSIETYEGVIFGSPLHYAKHDPRVAWCIRENRRALATMPTGFFSVSLGINSTHLADREDAVDLSDSFLSELHWEPTLTAHFAGALAYSRYGWLKKRLMHWIASRSGEKDTDYDHDYEYTDWEAVESFAKDFASLIKQSAGQARTRRTLGRPSRSK